MKKIIKKNAGAGQRNKGYALLFAVLVSAIVLGVGVSILNISRKELLLTEGAEQSQYAFYAADTGYECALYQDYINGAFTSTTTGTTKTVYCGTTYPTAGPQIYPSPVTVSQTGSGVGTAQYQYVFNIPVSAVGSCAAVTVTKNYIITTVGTSTIIAASTTVLSDGFNVGWEASSTSGDCNALSNTKVERALLANY